MKRSGLADSPFFSQPKKPASVSPDTRSAPIRRATRKTSKTHLAAKTVDRDGEQPNNRDTRAPRDHESLQPRNHEPTVSRHHETIIEDVRKAVKELGKEAATHRFTTDEKKVLADTIRL